VRARISIGIGNITFVHMMRANEPPEKQEEEFCVEFQGEGPYPETQVLDRDDLKILVSWLKERGLID